jgi:hypothetical protein
VNSKRFLELAEAVAPERDRQVLLESRTPFGTGSKRELMSAIATFSSLPLEHRSSRLREIEESASALGVDLERYHSHLSMEVNIERQA